MNNYFKDDNMDNIEVIEDKTLELEFIAHGESHSVCNALRSNLMKDKDVEYAVYSIDHPLIGEPIMTIKTKRGKRPKKVLLKASKKLKKDSEEFKKLIESI
jgi:DNA-directed RNA polymerase subunit L